MSSTSTSNTLPGRRLLLALAVVAIWGSNFAIIKVALAALPPMLFAALRFLIALVPAVFFLARPRVPWRNLAAYGMLIGVGQFGLMYLAVTRFISPGLASLVVQTQVLFTIGFSLWLGGERIRPFQVLALIFAAAGLGIIVAHTDRQTTPLGLILVLGAALSWSGGNLVARSTPGVNMLAYVVWASLFSVPPLVVLSLIFEGPSAMVAGVRGATLATWLAVVWQSAGNTLFGYAAWGWLLARHPATTVMPMALLVPVFGMAASAWWLGESLPPWKLLAAALVLAGLGLNLLWPWLRLILWPKSINSGGARL